MPYLHLLSLVYLLSSFHLLNLLFFTVSLSLPLLSLFTVSLSFLFIFSLSLYLLLHVLLFLSLLSHTNITRSSQWKKASPLSKIPPFLPLLATRMILIQARWHPLRPLPSSSIRTRFPLPFLWYMPGRKDTELLFIVSYRPSVHRFMSRAFLVCHLIPARCVMVCDLGVKYSVSLVLCVSQRRECVCWRELWLHCHMV